MPLRKEVFRLRLGPQRRNGDFEAAHLLAYLRGMEVSGTVLGFVDAPSTHVACYTDNHDC